MIRSATRWLLAAALPLAVMSCRLPEPVEPGGRAESTGELRAPEGFDFSLMSTRTFTVAVSTSSGDPYPDAAVHLLSAEGSLIETRPTDPDGRAIFAAPAPEGYLRLHVTAVGIPAETLVVKASSPVVSLPAAYSNPVEGTTSATRGFAARSASWSIPSTSSSGLPAGLDVTRRSEVTASFLSDVNFAFPENSRVPDRHPEYIRTENTEEIELTDSAEMHLTFLHEGAGYRNSFGYYVVPPGGTVGSARALDKRVIFPNASLLGSGGALVAGDRIRLGAFPAGTRIGFFVIADGWNGSRVDTTGKPTYYSRSALNPEANESQRRHLAMLLHQQTGKVVLGFEDLNRGTAGCDQDFNDVLFTVAWNPFPAIRQEQFVPLPGRTDSDNDGVSDNLDAYPNDPARAFDRYFPSSTEWGTAAFEDLWPGKGDFDFNDLVVRYRVRETRNAKQEVRDVDAVFVPVAKGASLHSGLAIGLGMLAAAPESTHVAAGSRTTSWPLQRNAATGETILRLTRDAASLFRTADGRMVNTLPGAARHQADTLRARIVFGRPVVLPDPPYDLFLFRSSDSAHEIHLPDKKGTGTAKRSLFRTKDDRTDSVKGTWYRTSGNLPWAINMPGSWRHPMEGIDIAQAYPSFATWISSAGRTELDWYTRPASPSLVSP